MSRVWYWLHSFGSKLTKHKQKASSNTYVRILSQATSLRIESLIQFLLMQNRYESKRAGQYVCPAIDLSWLHQAGLIVNHFTRCPQRSQRNISGKIDYPNVVHVLPTHCEDIEPSLPHCRHIPYYLSIYLQLPDQSVH